MENLLAEYVSFCQGGNFDFKSSFYIFVSTIQDTSKMSSAISHVIHCNFGDSRILNLLPLVMSQFQLSKTIDLIVLRIHRLSTICS